jgi:hypothetical protein
MFNQNANFFRAINQDLSEHVATNLVSEPGPLSIATEAYQSPRVWLLHPVTVVSNCHRRIDRLIDTKMSKQ